MVNDELVGPVKPRRVMRQEIQFLLICSYYVQKDFLIIIKGFPPKTPVFAKSVADGERLDGLGD